MQRFMQARTAASKCSPRCDAVPRPAHLRSRPPKEVAGTQQSTTRGHFLWGAVTSM